jgi:hypothetical protein
VQDGGAVLGFAYHDLMARLKIEGPEAAWARLTEIADWYGEVVAAGGYRAYYADGRDGATLQGGGTAGGLGLDHEFFESVLVPQVMLYGFLGYRPEYAGFRLNPVLPDAWPSLEIRRIRLRDLCLDIKAGHTTVDIAYRGAWEGPLELHLPVAPDGVSRRRWTVVHSDAAGSEIERGNAASGRATVRPGVEGTLRIRWGSADPTADAPDV